MEMTQGMTQELFDRYGRSVGWAVFVPHGRLDRLHKAIRTASDKIRCILNPHPENVQFFISRAEIAALTGTDVDAVDIAPWLAAYQPVIMHRADWLELKRAQQTRPMTESVPEAQAESEPSTLRLFDPESPGPAA